MNKENLIGYVEDAMANFLYYDRKEDEDFTVEMASKLTYEEVLEAFQIVIARTFHRD